jgi:Ca-activated chloride channel family protein
MRVLNMGKVSVCLLCIALMLFVGCSDNKAKEKAKTQAQVEERAKAQPDRIERVEIPLDNAQGVAELSRNFYFIFDGSGSMNDKSGGLVKLVGAKQAVRRFLTKIPDDANLGLFVFDAQGAREVVSLGPNNREAFMESINEVRASGTTPLAQSIKFGTDRLIDQYKKQLGYGDYRLIVVTDGQASNIPGAAQYAGRYGMPIYAIGLFMEGDHPLRKYAVSYREANDYEGLEQALEDALAELPSFDPTEFEE